MSPLERLGLSGRQRTNRNAAHQPVSGADDVRAHSGRLAAPRPSQLNAVLCGPSGVRRDSRLT